MLKGGVKSFHSLKRGGGAGTQKVLPCLEGGRGVHKVSGSRFSHFVTPLPLINDQSLRVNRIHMHSNSKYTANHSQSLRSKFSACVN